MKKVMVFAVALAFSLGFLPEVLRAAEEQLSAPATPATASQPASPVAEVQPATPSHKPMAKKIRRKKKAMKRAAAPTAPAPASQAPAVPAAPEAK